MNRRCVWRKQKQFSLLGPWWMVFYSKPSDKSSCSLFSPYNTKPLPRALSSWDVGLYPKCYPVLRTKWSKMWVVSSAPARCPTGGEDNGYWLQVAVRSYHMASVPRTWQCCHQWREQLPELCEQLRAMGQEGKTQAEGAQHQQHHCSGWAGGRGGLLAPNLLVCWCTSIWTYLCFSENN